MGWLSVLVGGRVCWLEEGVREAAGEGDGAGLVGTHRLWYLEAHLGHHWRI